MRPGPPPFDRPQRDARKLQRVGRRREPVVKVDQAPEAFDQDAVQAPARCVAQDLVPNGLVAEEAANKSPSGLPAGVVSTS